MESTNFSDLLTNVSIGNEAKNAVLPTANALKYDVTIPSTVVTASNRVADDRVVTRQFSMPDGFFVQNQISTGRGKGSPISGNAERTKISSKNNTKYFRKYAELAYSTNKSLLDNVEDHRKPSTFDTLKNNIPATIYKYSPFNYISNSVVNDSKNMSYLKGGLSFAGLGAGGTLLYNMFSKPKLEYDEYGFAVQPTSKFKQYLKNTILTGGVGLALTALLQHEKSRTGPNIFDEANKYIKSKQTTV